MIFLLEYDRQQGKLISVRNFQESEVNRAADLRLERELELNDQGIVREVVLLEASSEKALQRTHRRYFVSLSELAQSTA